MKDPEKNRAYRKAWGLRQHGKPCPKCETIDRFPNGNCRPCGSAAQQKAYRANPLKFKKGQVARYYGISGDEKERLYELQHGLCKFCNVALPEVWARGCHVEHDHKTGRVRGLVHHQCNIIVGLFENEKYISLVKAYLQ